MPQRIVTDTNGDRWDVRQAKDSAELSFRHQSGTEYSIAAPAPLDEATNVQLLRALDDARRSHGDEPVGEGGRETSLDPEGYTTN
jgi:hypothetical protein